ncbi:MAG: hypothetical protein HN826_14080 [Methylococcales bacterium]|nr:hypothetical protein [Methylococcales bacterium]
MIFSNYNSLLCQFTTLLFLTISGCTQNINPNNIHHNSQNSDLEQCRLMFSNIKKTITDNHTQDAQASTIKNFPYLRNNRFLASFRQQTLSDLAFKQWINQMEAIALQSIQIEIHNLPPTIKSSMPTKQQIKNCSQQLKKQDFFQSKSRFSNISQLKTMTIDEEYQTWKRFFGAYWLTSWGMKLGIHQMHKTIKATYQVSLDKLTDNKRLIHYVPAEKIKKSSTTNIRKMIKNSYNNDLKIPQLSNSELSQLFENFAPIWAIDVKTNQDKIGNPQWIQGMQQAVIDIAHPNIFHYHSHTRFNHKNLLQLNYVIWFPSRPAESFIDILSGHLDGLIWRVTLDEDGSVLVYDPFITAAAIINIILQKICV